MKILSKHATENETEYSSKFAAAKPFKYVVIDDFLDKSHAEMLLDEFPAVSDPSTLLNEFGTPNPKSCISDLKALGGVYDEFDTFIQSDGFLRYIERLTGIPNLKYDPYYYGAGTHENFHGAGLDPHYDFNIHPNTGQHRRLNAIIYLNKEWDARWGGTLCLHKDAWDIVHDEVIEIEPRFNRMIVFETTESSWHLVPIINQPDEFRHLSRKSLTIYLYTDERPSYEIEPPHGTVYVQQGIAKHIKSGYTLNDSDVHEILMNISRRQSYLREMYKREYKYSAVIESLRHQIVDLERSVHVPLLGYALVSRIVNPTYLDRWIKKEFTVEVIPLRPIVGVRLSGFRHVGWGDVKCTFSFGSMSLTQVVQGGEVYIDLKFDRAINEPAMLEFRAERSQQASEHDLRSVSILLYHVEFIH